MAEELVPIQKNDYNELLLQTVAVIEHARIKVARYNAAIASNSYCEIGKLHHEKKLYWLGKEKDSEKLKQLVSVINAEKMHHVGAEWVNSKRQQSVGELQFTVNHGRIKTHQVGGDIQRLVSKSYSKIGMELP